MPSSTCRSRGLNLTISAAASPIVRSRDPAPDIGRGDADGHLRVTRRIVQHGRVNYLGLSAMTTPVGRDRAGMPVGLQLTAPAGAEERLFAIALAAERVLGTAVDPA